MKTFIRIAGVAAALALTSSAYAGVNLVKNGEFSSGSFGWHNDSDSVEVLPSWVYGLTAANAGGYNLEVNANISPSTVYQDISGLVVGATYALARRTPTPTRPPRSVARRSAPIRAAKASGPANRTRSRQPPRPNAFRSTPSPTRAAAPVAIWSPTWRSPLRKSPPGR